jgi:hypothetical protein
MAKRTQDTPRQYRAKLPFRSLRFNVSSVRFGKSVSPRTIEVITKKLVK